MQPEEEAIARGYLIRADRRAVPEQQRCLPVQLVYLTIRKTGALSDDHAKLVKRQARPHLNREGAGNYLKVEPALVTRLDLIEQDAAVCDNPREYVEASGRALGIRLRSHATRQVEFPQEADPGSPAPVKDH